MNLELHKEDGYATITISGHIDLGTSPELRRICLDLSRKKTQKIVIDVTDVSYIDSSGVATLVELLQRIADYQGKMALVGINERAREVFEITNLAGVFKFYDSAEEALGEMQ